MREESGRTLAARSRLEGGVEALKIGDVLKGMHLRQHAQSLCAQSHLSYLRSTVESQKVC